MGQCGPVEPCPGCTDLYDKDPRYIRGREVGSPDKFVIASDYDRRKRKTLDLHQYSRYTPATAMPSQDRLPDRGQSKRQAKRRRQEKRRRRS